MRRRADLKIVRGTEPSDAISLSNEEATAKKPLPRPANYFADDYESDKERVALESAMSKITQRPER
jgi:hypothetical protein